MALFYTDIFVLVTSYFVLEFCSLVVIVHHCRTHGKKGLEPNSKAPLGKSKVSKYSFSNVEMAYSRIEETNPLPWFGKSNP